MGEAQTKTTYNEEQLLKQAEALAACDRWDKAATVIENVQTRMTLSIEARGKLAYYHSRAGNHSKALTLFQELCQSQPAERKWHYGVGYQFQQKEQWGQAVTAYTQALQVAPRWLKIYLALGRAYQSNDQADKALETYRNGLRLYKDLSPDFRLPLAPIYGKLCHGTAEILLSKATRQPADVDEALRHLCESAEIAPTDPNSWYRLGRLLLDLGRLDEALEYLSKAESLAPTNEYILHKLAQVHLKKGEIDEALKRYEKVPNHRQSPYILRGMAQCYLANNQPMEAAKKLYRAIKKEPDKFYHYWDFAQALIALRATEQAIEALETTNRLFEQENGKSYKRATVRLEEIRANLQPGERISFENPVSPVSTICFGTITKYDDNRGFGFIKDQSDGAKVFFHISCLKERIPPKIGANVKFVRELGEKGPTASRVWLSGK